VIYAMIAAVNPRADRVRWGCTSRATGGAHWTLRTRIPGVAGPQGDTSATADPRRWGALAAVICRPSSSIRKRKVISRASIVMWRSEDGGDSWSAVRGSPGGDDYQRI